MFRREGNGRRAFLKLAAFSLAGVTAPSARGLYQAQRATIQRPDTPEHAIDLLVQGNQRYVAQKLISFQEDLDILKAETEEHQEPFAAVLSCADSRVPMSWFSTKASVMSSWFGWPATWPRRTPSPAWNMVRRCWE